MRATSSAQTALPLEPAGVLPETRAKTLSARTGIDADSARARASGILAAAIRSAGASYADVATHLDVDPGLVARWCDERREETIGLHRVLDLPATVLAHFVRLLAAESGERTSAVPVEARAYRVLAAAGDETADLARKLADGDLDAEERRSLVPVLGHGIDVRVSLLAGLTGGGR